MKKFTDRYLEMSRIVYDEEAASSSITTVKLNVYDISSYGPYLDKELSVPSGVEVCMKNGESYFIPVAMEKFEEDVNMHHAIMCHV